MGTAYVLLSGGVDSSTCLAMARANHDKVVGLSLIYGQRHQNEIGYARQVADHFDCEHIVHDIRGILGVGGLTDESLEIPKMSYDDMDPGVSPTYVPFRNGTLLSIAASVASADPDGEAVYYGAHAEDAANSAYPDCSPEFAEAMGQAIEIGTYNQVVLWSPLIDFTKATVIKEGDALGVPWALTWSCYEGGAIHCGTCPTCISRREAFIGAGVDDPTIYADDIIKRGEQV